MRRASSRNLTLQQTQRRLYRASRQPSLSTLNIDITEHKQKAIDISQGEMRFRALAESSQDYIVLYDHECRHVFVNHATLQFMDKAETDVIGKTPSELGLDAEMRESWEADIRSVFVTGKPIQRISEWQVSSGIVYLDWRLSPILNENGRVELTLAIARNITAIKQTEKMQRQ